MCVCVSLSVVMTYDLSSLFICVCICVYVYMCIWVHQVIKAYQTAAGSYLDDLERYKLSTKPSRRSNSPNNSHSSNNYDVKDTPTTKPQVRDRKNSLSSSSSSTDPCLELEKRVKAILARVNILKQPFPAKEKEKDKDDFNLAELPSSHFLPPPLPHEIAQIKKRENEREDKRRGRSLSPGPAHSNLDNVGPNSGAVRDRRRSPSPGMFKKKNF